MLYLPCLQPFPLPETVNCCILALILFDARLFLTDVSFFLMFADGI